MSRIQLIGASIDDFEDYYQIRCEPSDIYWMGHSSPPDYQMIRGVFSERLAPKTLTVEGDKIIYMAKNVDGETVGFAMLSLTNDGIEIGISLLQKFQGLGCGTEIISEIVSLATEKYEQTLFARIRDDNTASQRIFMKNGFKRTEQFEIKEYPKAGCVPFRKYVRELVH